jgi:hypothetical protein
MPLTWNCALQELNVNVFHVLPAIAPLLMSLSTTLYLRTTGRQITAEQTTKKLWCGLINVESQLCEVYVCVSFIYVYSVNFDIIDTLKFCYMKLRIYIASRLKTFLGNFTKY